MFGTHSKEKCDAKTVKFPCYYCHELVLYFSCDCGSSVLFQEPAPPWTKHHCEEYLNQNGLLADINKRLGLWLRWDTAESELNKLSKRVMRNICCDGVYIIWYFDKSNYPKIVPKIVKVGRGSIRECLEADRRDPKVQRYAAHTLQVTWTSVPSNYLDSVAAYLSQGLQPLVGSRYSADTPIRVELPWTLRRFYRVR